MKYVPVRNRLEMGVLATLVALAAVALSVSAARAGGGPENYFLVVNSRSPSSLTIANHYIALRQIPATNVFYIDWDGDKILTDIDTFRKRILEPTLLALDSRELTTHIDGIVYSSDFPYNIDFQGDLPANERNPPTHPTAPKVGSITGLTFYWQQVLARQAVYGDLRYVSNLYWRQVVEDKQGTASNVYKEASETRGFRSWYGWTGTGNLTEAGGNRYMLSMMLGLTVGKGNTPAEVVNYLDRSAKVDGSRPQGTIYYTSTDDVRTKTRQPYFSLALAKLKELGVKAEIVDVIVPTDKQDIAGGMFGHANLGWDATNNTILPGAIVDNLTSYGAEMPNVGRHTLLTEFLRSGAAGSAGTGVEPTAIPHKFPSALVHVHYARGSTLAEAFYQSVAAPYQLVMVGDPLCRPWVKAPTIAVGDLNSEDVLKGQVVIKPTASGGTTEVDRFELYLDGARIDSCAKGGELTLDTTKQSDGFHEIRVVGIESGAIETQGRLILPVKFDNNGRSMTFTAAVQQTGRERSIQLSADAPGAKTIMFHVNGRKLGEVRGEKGNFTAKTAGLGSGPVTIRAIGLGATGVANHVLAQPVTVELN
jgi:hypothetical protein